MMALIAAILFWLGGIGGANAAYSLSSEKLDVAARSAATLILGFIWLFLWWEGSILTHINTSLFRSTLFRDKNKLKAKKCRGNS
jgi:hypothetical protein